MRFKRSGGILLHPISLPGRFGCGDLGACSYHFVDWLVTARQKLWQMLPIGPIGEGNSPYLSLSAFAGNPLLIDLETLVGKGWLRGEDIETSVIPLSNRIDYNLVVKSKMPLLKKAAENFLEQNTKEDKNAFEEFCEKERYWLHDYALFQVLNGKLQVADWTLWDSRLKNRDEKALKEVERNNEKEIIFHKFTQWCFSFQWKNIKEYANNRGIKLVGDIPIFVSHHSVDVWARQNEYLLDETGKPKFVAGVPPDYFSSTGQRWGNPIYNWKEMKKTGYEWWKKRFKKALELFDIIRIDHFRGFESYWEIPAEEESAINGKWVKGPGFSFFKSIQNEIGNLPVIAEDLGIITSEVNALRERLGFPGMKVLQFAFSGDPSNPYLPHNYDRNCVVYTGTHDNDTTCGWYEKLSEKEKKFLMAYCNIGTDKINWVLIKLAFQSVADLVLIPFQDVLGLGSEARMNFPGTKAGNWEWRFFWEQVGPIPAQKLGEITAIYSR